MHDLKRYGSTCGPNYLQFYGLYLLIKEYLLLNCRQLGLQEHPQIVPTVLSGLKTPLNTSWKPTGLNVFHLPQQLFRVPWLALVYQYGRKLRTTSKEHLGI